MEPGGARLPSHADFGARCGRCVRAGAGDDGHSLPGAYRETVYLGLTTSHRVALANGAELTVRVVSDAGADATPAPGTYVRVQWKPGAARLHVN